MEKTPVAELFSQVESVDDDILKSIPEDKQKPRMGDESWTEYVISLLGPGEYVLAKEKKLPKTDALRRLSTKILGKVLKSKAHPPQLLLTDKGLIAAVSHELLVEKYGDEGTVEVWGVADVREECLTFPFSQHVTSNASTKAMGRAYRDLLQLQVCVAEELNNVGELVVVDDPDDAGPADSTQKKAIIATCKRLGIDVNKLLNSGPFKHRDIDQVLRGTGRKIMSLLNGFQSGNEIPEEIRL